LGIGDWGLGPIPNPQSPIPNPQICCLIDEPNDITETPLFQYIIKFIKYNSLY
jgi:hypothetical protein